MSNRPDAAKRLKGASHHPKHAMARAAWRALRAGGPYALLGLAIVTLVLAVAGVVGAGVPRTIASGTGGSSTGNRPPVPANMKHTCGFPGLPACPVATPQWISLRSTSGADIVAAARQSNLFNINTSGQGDTPSLSRLGTPVLELALSKSGVGQGPDYYLIPIQDSTGATLGVIMCQVNAARTAIYVSAIAQWMHVRPAGQVTVVSAQAAASDLEAQAHVALRAGTAPQLVYFLNSYAAVNSGASAWNAGGVAIDDPVWLLMGADGMNRVVGTDGHVYSTSQVPLS